MCVGWLECRLFIYYNFKSLGDDFNYICMLNGVDNEGGW